MKGTSVDIRPITRIEDVNQIEDIQRQTWKMEELDIVPARIFHTMQRNGACLLGAYDGNKVVGFVFGLLGTVEGLDDRIDQVAAARLLMYSVTMGILPEYQCMGIGYRLKVGQREFALRIGVRLITWTFDPLESLNGYLNFQKLGVVCHQYLQNYYGEMSGINVGLPSDRFSIEWWVTSNRVTGRVSQKRGPLTLSQYLGGRALIVNECDVDEHTVPIPPAEFLRRESSLIIVEIPDDIQRIKTDSPLLARQWRQHIRSVFDYYFEQEYMVTDFVRQSDEDKLSRSYYVLTQAGS